MMSEKEILRAWARRTARAISGLRRAESDLAAAERLYALEAFKAAKTVFCYVSVGDEVSTCKIIESAIRLHKTVCVPRCLSGNIMEAVAISAFNDLECDLFQIPSIRKDGRIIPASGIDFAVLPCLCADQKGYRIGHGKGYYDRFLADYRGLSAVLCRKELLVNQIPVQPYDQKADFVIVT